MTKYILYIYTENPNNQTEKSKKTSTAYMAVSNCIDTLRISIIFSGRCVIAMKKKTGIQNNQVYVYIEKKKRTKKNKQ